MLSFLYYWNRGNNENVEDKVDGRQFVNMARFMRNSSQVMSCQTCAKM